MITLDENQVKEVERLIGELVYNAQMAARCDADGSKGHCEAYIRNACEMALRLHTYGIDVRSCVGLD